MKLEEALRQLISGRKAKRLHSLWPTIEEKLAEGVSHAEILELLNEHGIGISERTYKSYLYRYRKRHRTGEQQHTQMRLPETARPQSADASRVAASPGSTETEQHKRPPSFEYDPRGISPELLK